MFIPSLCNNNNNYYYYYYYKGRKQKERQVFGPCQGTRKVIGYECDNDISYNWCNQDSPKRLGKGIC